MVKIGPVDTKTNIFMACMAGCTNLAFRLIAREHGADFGFYEMLDSNSVVYSPGKKTTVLLESHPRDIPIAAQMLGSDPDLILKAVKMVMEMNTNISFLDINAACPAGKIIRKRAGAYLISEPELLYRIIDKLSSSLALPITVKLRTGYLSKDPEQMVAIARGCEENGAQAIFVHGRTCEQEYIGAVDHESIKAIKEGVKIPVIASGNIFSAQQAKEMIDLTGCDGILVARGACGNPWIFVQIKHYFEKGVLLPEPALKEKLAVLVRHLQYIENSQLLSAKSKAGFFRKVSLWYLRNMKNGPVIRAKVGETRSFGEICQLIESLAA